jgi:NTP pyrophosphatase (non-canonical NTP hydrolase)
MFMYTENEVIEAIRAELAKARKKFPRWPTTAVKSAAIVCEESGELIRAALQHEDENGMLTACDKEAIQTAAMCVRFLMRQ